MLVIKPSDGDNIIPKTLHDAFQQVYEKAIAATPL